MPRRSPSQYDWSNLEFDETILKKHITAPRRERIQFVVVHHMTIVGKDDDTNALTGCYNTWQTREASAHYGVQGGQVRQYVWDRNAAWSPPNTHGNHAGISIEHTNTTREPKWLVSEKTWKTGARLTAHLHKTYKLGRPVAGKTLRRHKDFFATGCPGPFLGTSNWAAYVKEAQRVYDEISEPKPPVPPIPPLKFQTKAYTINVNGAKPATFARRAKIIGREIATAAPSIVFVQECYAALRPLLTRQMPKNLTYIGSNRGKVIYADLTVWRLVPGSVRKFRLGNGKDAVACELEHRETKDHVAASSGHLSWKSQDGGLRRVEMDSWALQMKAAYPGVTKMYAADFNEDRTVVTKGVRNVCDHHGMRNPAETDVAEIMHGQYDTYNGYETPAPKHSRHIDGFEITKKLHANRVRVDHSEPPYAADHFGVEIRFGYVA